MTPHERARALIADLRTSLADMALPPSVTDNRRRSVWLTPPKTVGEIAAMHLDALERTVAAHEALPDAPPSSG